MDNQVEKRPNVLLVIVDDLSSYQLGCYGSKYYETPNLDAFAEKGIQFNRAYATGPVCSPARVSLYTGKHPARVHVTNFIPGTVPDNPRLITPDWQKGLPVGEQTLGTLFKENGYETAHMGKWHLAEDYNYQPHRPMDPESHGFDEVFYTRKPKPDFDPENDAHNVEKLTDKTLAFLRRPHERPFLCVLAHNTIHRPEMAPSNYRTRFDKKPSRESEWCEPVQAAMIAQLDDSFGRLMLGLEESGLDENTIVVFTSDHGAFADSEKRKPWRGAKADLYEGGLRVPFLVRFPTGLPERALVSSAVSMADLLPTLAELSGINLPNIELDGRSLVTGIVNGNATDFHQTFYWHYPHYHHCGLSPCGSMVRGRYKLIEWFESSIGESDTRPPFELFDLESDPWEEYDIARARPEVVEEMANALRGWRNSIGAQEMVPNPDFDPGLGGQRSEPPIGDKIITN